MDPLELALMMAKFTAKDIDEIIMVGGSTRMPLIQSQVSKFFGNKKINCQLHADEAIAVGAAL
jgi:molecular chaperone DnaK (HSP70)